MDNFSGKSYLVTKLLGGSIGSRRYLHEMGQTLWPRLR